MAPYEESSLRPIFVRNSKANIKKVTKTVEFISLVIPLHLMQCNHETARNSQKSWAIFHTKVSQISNEAIRSKNQNKRVFGYKRFKIVSYGFRTYLM